MRISDLGGAIGNAQLNDVKVEATSAGKCCSSTDRGNLRKSALSMRQMSSHALEMRRIDAATFAWMFPSFAAPVAIALLAGATGFERAIFLDSSTQALFAFGALVSLASAALVFRAAPTPRRSVWVAMLPFLLVFPAATLASGLRAERMLNHGTYCGPVTREQVISFELAELFVFRMIPLFIVASGIMLVTFAFLTTRRDEEPASLRWSGVLSGAALSASFLVLGLGVALLRRKTFELPDVEGQIENWLSILREHYADCVRSSTTLALSSLVLAAGALLRQPRRAELGLRALVFVAIVAVGGRAAVLADELLLARGIEEAALFMAVRPIDDDTFSYRVQAEPLGTVKTVEEHLADWKQPPEDWRSEFARYNLEFAKSREVGLPIIWPITVSHDFDATDLSLRETLHTLRVGGVSDVVLNSPFEPYGRAPSALRPFVAYRDSFDWSDAISVRFDDEPACQPVTLYNAPRVMTPSGRVSAWTLECEAIPISQLTRANAHELASNALKQGKRLVVITPR